MASKVRYLALSSVVLAVLCGAPGFAQEPAASPTSAAALPKFALARHGSDRLMKYSSTERAQATTTAGPCLAYAGYPNGYVRLWDTCKKTLVAEIKPFNEDPVWLGASPDAKTLAVVPSKGPVQLWDASSRTLRAEVVGLDAADCRHLLASAAGLIVSTAKVESAPASANLTHSYALHLYSWEDGRELGVYQSSSASPSRQVALQPALSPDESWISWIDVEHHKAPPQVWIAPLSALQEARALAPLEPKHARPFLLSFTPDSARLIVAAFSKGSEEGPLLHAHLWTVGGEGSSPDVVSTPLNEEIFEEIEYGQLAFTPDNAMVAITGEFYISGYSGDLEPLRVEIDMTSGEVAEPNAKRKWISQASKDVQIPELTRDTLPDQAVQIDALLVSPDGRTLLTHQNGTSAWYRWNLDAGAISEPWDGPDDKRLIAFAADHSTVIALDLTWNPEPTNPHPPSCEDALKRSQKWRFSASKPKAQRRTLTVHHDTNSSFSLLGTDPDGQHVWVCAVENYSFILGKACGESKSYDEKATIARVHLGTGAVEVQKPTMFSCPSPEEVNLQSKRALIQGPHPDEVLKHGFFREDFGDSSFTSDYESYEDRSRPNQLVDITTGAVIASFKADSKEDLVLSPDGLQIARRSPNYETRWDLTLESASTQDDDDASEESEEPWSRPVRETTPVRFSADGRLLIITEGSKILAFSAQNPKRDPVVLSGHTQPISDLIVNPQNRLYSAQWDGIVYAWDLDAVAASFAP